MAGQGYIWVVSWYKKVGWGTDIRNRKAFVSKVKALQFMVKLKNDSNTSCIALKKSFDGD